MKRGFTSTSPLNKSYSSVSSFTKVGPLEEGSSMILPSSKDGSGLEETVKKNSYHSITSIEVASMSRSDSYISVSNHEHQTTLKYIREAELKEESYTKLFLFLFQFQSQKSFYVILTK